MTDLLEDGHLVFGYQLFSNEVESYHNIKKGNANKN